MKVRNFEERKQATKWVIKKERRTEKKHRKTKNDTKKLRYGLKLGLRFGLNKRDLIISVQFLRLPCDPHCAVADAVSHHVILVLPRHNHTVKSFSSSYDVMCRWRCHLIILLLALTVTPLATLSSSEIYTFNLLYPIRNLITGSDGVHKMRSKFKWMAQVLKDYDVVECDGI